MSAKECPNKDRLSEDEQRKLEEENYRVQEKYEWGYLPGDPRLSSMGSDGKKENVAFGKAIDTKEDEDGELETLEEK